MPRALVLLLAGLTALASAGAQGLPPPAPLWKITVPTGPIQSGVPFTVRAVVQLPVGYYQDADSLFLEFEAPEPVTTVARTQSAPGLRGDKRAFTGSFELERTLVITGPHPNGPLSLSFRTGWQICQGDGVCLLPVETTTRVTLEWGGPAAPETTTLANALVAAFLGGLLLNLMPCVFPVLALKAVALATSAGHSRRSQRRRALAFAAGSSGSVLALGLATGVAAWVGQRLDWGFAFQQPVFVWLLLLAFGALTLQLLGLVSWRGLPFGLTTSNQGRRSSFAAGAFLVIAAAPCTAPLLGPALGFALTRPPAEIPLYFLAIGIGLALPLLLLGLFPHWGRWLPRPGRWMQRLERVAGVLLMATVAYLLWIFWVQNGALRGALALILLALTALAAVLWPRVAIRHRRVVRLAATFALVVASVFLVSPAATRSGPPLSEGWEEYSADRLTRALDSGRPVLVDGTAAWCATCQVNEWAVLHRPDVFKALEQRGVVLLRADYTSPHPEVAQWLESVHRAGLPVYALYRRGHEVYLFPEVLTDQNFLTVLPGLLGQP